MLVPVCIMNIQLTWGGNAHCVLGHEEEADELSPRMVKHSEDCMVVEEVEKFYEAPECV